MDYNLANGGLIAVTGNGRLISDPAACRTIHRSKLDMMGWFMNVADGGVYFSDQRRRNSICFLDPGNERVEVLVDQPGYGLVLHQGSLIYLNEEDGRLYRCDLRGRDRNSLLGEPVTGFAIEGDFLYAATNRGIIRCRLDGTERDTVTGGRAFSMVLTTSGKLVFADHANHGRLTLVDLVSGRTDMLQEIVPISLNTDGHYLYCTNGLYHRHIFRIDPETPAGIRICGWTADYLHVITDEIWFWSNRKWHCMPLSGGQPRSVMEST